MLMLTPYTLTSSGSHLAWKKESLSYYYKKNWVRLTNKRLQFVTQMKNNKRNKKKIKQNFHHVYHRHPRELAQGQGKMQITAFILKEGMIILT